MHGHQVLPTGPLLLSCASPVSPRALHAASVASPPPVDASGPSVPSGPASEAPCAAEAASHSDDDWDALLDAHRLAPPPMSLQPPSPSRPTPLELVGALPTSAAVAFAKPPSAPCGVRSKRPRRVSHATWPALVASLAVVLVLDTSTLLRIKGEELADLVFSCAAGAGTWRGGSFAHFRGSCGRFAGRGLFWCWRWTWRGRSWESCP